MKSIKIPKQHLNWLDNIRSDLDYTWDHLFKNLQNNKEDLITLARDKTAWEIMAENTIGQQLDLWLLNIRRNLPLIESNSNIMDLPKVNEPILCVGNGPSFHEHIDEIKEFKGTILCCEVNLVKLLEHGIIPTYMLSIDSHDWYTKFIDNPIVDKYADQITAVVCGTVSPEFLTRWPGKVSFFISYIDNTNKPLSVSKTIITLTDTPSMQTDGNAGSALWFLAILLKATHVVLLGLDFAYKCGITLDQTTIWPYINHLPKKDILACYCREFNPFGKEIITDCNFSSSRYTTHSWIAEEKGIETIQCSEYTIMHEPPLKLMTFREYLDEQNTENL